MIDRSPKKSSNGVPYSGIPKEALRGETPPSFKALPRSSALPPLIEPSRTEIKPVGLALSPDANTSLALSQILRDLLLTPPSHSNGTKDEQMRSSDRVAGAITPPSDVGQSDLVSNRDEDDPMDNLPLDALAGRESVELRNLNSEPASVVAVDSAVDESSTIESTPVETTVESRSGRPSMGDRSESAMIPAGTISAPRIPADRKQKEIVPEDHIPITRSELAGDWMSAMNSKVSPSSPDGVVGYQTPVAFAPESWRSQDPAAVPIAEGSESQPPSTLRLNLGDQIEGRTQITSPGGSESTRDDLTPYSTFAATDDSRLGTDSGRTNTLLEQILEELRKSRPPSFVASGRSAYPER